MCEILQYKQKNRLPHENATFNKIAFSRNDFTHPHPTDCEALAKAKAPSAKDGALRGVATLARDGEILSLRDFAQAKSWQSILWIASL